MHRHLGSAGTQMGCRLGRCYAGARRRRSPDKLYDATKAFRHECLADLELAQKVPTMVAKSRSISPGMMRSGRLTERSRPLNCICHGVENADA